MIAPCAGGVKPLINFQFVVLPAEILRRPDLSPAAKLLAAVVMDSARGSRAGTCRLSNATLGARIGKSAATIKRLLAELEAAGLVRRDTIAEKHVRTAIVPTWVAQERATEQASAVQGRAGSGAEMSQGVAQDRSTIQSSLSEPNQTGSISLDSEEETGAGPRPTPQEVAVAIRQMAAGKYAPKIWPSPASTPSGSALTKRVDPPGTSQGRPSALPRDAHDLARGIFVDARRAAYVKPRGGRRKTASQQLEELRQWSQGRST